MKHGMRILLLAGILGTLSLVTGCGGKPGGTARLTPVDRAGDLTQTFSQAYITRGRAGEYDIILTDAAADWDYRQGKARKNKPLEPQPLAPLRQVMHIHLYWRPLLLTTKNPAAINASINWYVLGPDGSQELQVYEGAAYVALYGGGNHRTISIRDGRISPKLQRGQIHDPIGTARITGRFGVVANDARVRETINELQKQAALARK